jgi:Putative DNA-binding domain
MKLKTKSDLDALLAANVKENLHLEYKASPAIDKRDDRKKVEMARDVSAFANSDGGQIIYGMTENEDHEPSGLDGGVDGKVYPEIWFEQVLQQHIVPPIPGLRIRHVSLNKPMVAIVIDVPATKADPHQVSDGRYYRRHNFSRVIMEHYEVRDAIRRSVDPDLILEFDLLVGQAAYKTVEFSQYRDLSDPAPIGAVIRNRSNQPAMYTFVSIFLDRRLKIASRGLYVPYPERKFAENDLRNQLTLKLGVPDNFPIFKEMGYMIDPFTFTISDRLLGHSFGIGYELRAPGCFKANHGYLEFGHSGQMTLKMPPN